MALMSPCCSGRPHRRAVGNANGAWVRAALFGERTQGGDHNRQGRSSVRISAVRIMLRGQIPIYEEVRRRDALFYSRLTKSGFKVDFGEDESGLMMKAMRPGSGYYIDVGGSDLIAKGHIAVRSDSRT